MRAVWRSAALAAVLALSAATAPTAAAKPTPTPSPTPTEPLPIEIVVHPDSDVLGQPGVLVSDGMPAPPRPPATGWMVVDVDTGDVLAAENARAQLAPASTLKLLTGLTVAPRLPDDNGLYTASPATEVVDGTRVGLTAGSIYRVTDLLNGMLISSGNDTAVALSELVGGDPAASALMNAQARQLGATDTVAVNTSGLDAPGQVSSARDLALIGTAVLDDPRLAPIVARPNYRFPSSGTDFGPEREYYEIDNHNKMLGVYPGTLGLKTGYTTAARGSFVGAAQQGGRRVMCTILHAEGQESDQCKALLDWAFGSGVPQRPVTTLAASVRASAPPAPPPTAQASRPAGDGAASVAGSDQSDGDTTVPGWRGWLLLPVIFAGMVGAALLVVRLLTGPARRQPPSEPPD